MKGVKTVYVCSECSNQSPKWLGKCPSCGAWNSFVEDVVESTPGAAQANDPKPPRFTVVSGGDTSLPFSELSIEDATRTPTGMGEFDRVLGGGLVTGSVVLLSGEPGIGKSTLLLQICDVLGKSRRVLYVSGEESGSQLKLRAKRLGVKGTNLFVYTETNVEKIMKEVDRLKPSVIIVDSIQTLYSGAGNSIPGSVSQVKESALSFIGKAKTDGISVLIVGHVNKEGAIAGPKVLEHMVDAVLYFEGDHRQSCRIIRAGKNRYGSTDEIGVFEMTDRGLLEIENPSAMLLSGRPKNTPGNCAVCLMEGTRPLIAEIQALVTPTTFPAPRRTANGVDYNRMCLILAVLEKRLGLKFSQNDVYLNVIGGLRIDEPSADVGIALALISSLTDRVIPDDLIAIGELGLAGECRAVTSPEHRLNEAKRLGFSTVVIPHKNLERRKIDTDLSIVEARSVYETLSVLLPKNE